MTQRSRSRDRDRHYYKAYSKRRRSYSVEKRRVRRNDFYHFDNSSRNVHFENNYHFHRHTHYYPSSRSKKHASTTTISSALSSESNQKQRDDMEGTVNLKHVTSIYRRRYEIGKKLGVGTFGSVYSCIDNKRKIRVAMKIVRSVKRYLDAAEIEIEILNKLDELDLYKNSLIIRLYKSFRVDINGKEHSCLVMEKCGKSLYDIVKRNDYKGFPLDIVAIIGYQLVHAISFCHNNKLCHTDLKLENILFCCDELVRDARCKLYFPRNSFEIRLIDFGGATFESDHHSTIINTRQYRGPEVVLNLPWSYPSDIWSIGCILSELYCGELLFATHDDTEHLHLMKKMLVVNEFPKHMINKKNESMLEWPTSNSANVAKSMKYIQRSKTLNQLIADDHLFDFIQKCLVIDPNRRITALQAKNHPFFLQFRQNSEFSTIYNLINRHQL